HSRAAASTSSSLLPQAPPVFLRSPTARCSAARRLRCRDRADASCADASRACSSKVTGSAVRTSNPNFSTSAAPVASAFPEPTCTSASPRGIVPNSPRLPFSPVSRLRTMLLISCLLMLDASHRGSGRGAPSAGHGLELLAPTAPATAPRPAWRPGRPLAPGTEDDGNLAHAALHGALNAAGAGRDA